MASDLNGPVLPIRVGGKQPRKPRLADGQRRTMQERADVILKEAWREIMVAEGSGRPRIYPFSAQRVCPTSKRKPGEIHWALYRRNLDDREARYYLSTAPEGHTLGEAGLRVRLAVAH